MSYWEKKIIRDQLDKKLSGVKGLFFIDKLDFAWIKTMRTALGMTTSQLAKRASLSQPRIVQIERAENEGTIKISTMQKIGEALNMRFIYGFVPNGSLQSMVENQALAVALRRLDKLNHTMRLEQQELSTEEKQKALNDMIQKVLLEEPKDFWD